MVKRECESTTKSQKKNNKRGIWSDASGFWTGIDYKKDYVGKLEKQGKKYIVTK